MRKLNNLAILSSCMLLGTALSVQAAPVAYDGFEQYSAGALSGASGGTGWSANWATDGAYMGVAAASLSYTGGAITINGGARAGQANDPRDYQDIAHRQFATQTGTLYFSFLYNAVSNWEGNDFLQFMLNNDTVNTNSGSIGDLSTSNARFGARIGMGNGGGTTDSGTNITPGTTYFLVGKISKTGVGHATDYDQMDLFINPTTLTEPGTTDATKVADSGITTLSYFSMRANSIDSSNGVVQFDELRIGTTYADVIPEPASGAVFLGGLAMLFAGRRRTA